MVMFNRTWSQIFTRKTWMKVDGEESESRRIKIQLEYKLQKLINIPSVPNTLFQVIEYQLCMGYKTIKFDG